MIDKPSPGPEHNPDIPLLPAAETRRENEDEEERQQEEERRRREGEEALAEAQQVAAIKDAENIAAAKENLEKTYSSSSNSSSGIGKTPQEIPYRTPEVSLPEPLKNAAKAAWETTKAFLGKLFG